MKEKRQFSRVNISFPVEYKHGALKDYAYTVSKDLSVGGVKILSDSFIPKNNLLKVNINIIDKVLQMDAKTVWCSREKTFKRYSVGLRFIDTTELSKKALSRFLNTIYNS
jgi:c-di-GMP-binding flagellar brake protein YcgR